MYGLYTWYICITYSIHTKLCELTDLQTWGIPIAVVAHLPPWRMAAAWADNGEALLCWRGWTDSPIQFTRSNTRCPGFSFGIRSSTMCVGNSIWCRVNFLESGWLLATFRRFYPSLPKILPEPTKLGVSGWVQWKARGYVTQKRDAGSRRIFKGWWKTWRWGKIDLFKAFQAFQPRGMMVWPAKSQISWTNPAGWKFP